MSMWEFLQTYGTRIASGTAMTCAQFACAAVLAVVVAVLAGLGKLSSNLLIKSISIAYIELFRGTSLLVQLFWVFFVLPLFGITLPAFTAGFVSVGLNIGAYGAEIVRAASNRCQEANGRPLMPCRCHPPNGCDGSSYRRPC
jgi:polar amino acid transport system permease protein